MTRFTTSLCLAALLIFGGTHTALASPTSGGDNPPKLSSLHIHYLDQLSLGAGGGFNYGGLGVNVLYYLHPNVAAYGGFGSDFQSGNYSVGLKWRRISGQSWNVNPYMIATYGYNGRLDVSSNRSMTKEFNGFAIGAGLDQRLYKGSPGYFTIGVLMPIRGQAYHDYAEYVQEQGIPSPKPVIPVRLMFGYHLVLR